LYKKIIFAAALLAMSLSSAAFAVTGNRVTITGNNRATLPATASVDASCGFSSNEGGQSAANNEFTFGDLTTATQREGAVSATATLTYVCNTDCALSSNRVPVGLSLYDTNGLHAAGSTTYTLVNTDAPSGTTNTINFDIAQSSSLTDLFQNSLVSFQSVTSAPVITLRATTTSTLQNLAAGSYSDTITATLNA
jgi:lipopolysaccharide export LptBFGC system permease protein LptF